MLGLIARILSLDANARRSVLLRLLLISNAPSVIDAAAEAEARGIRAYTLRARR